MIETRHTFQSRSFAKQQSGTSKELWEIPGIYYDKNQCVHVGQFRL